METKRDIEKNGLIAPIVGHVGDGNFHTSPVFDPADEGEKRKIEEFLGRLSERAIQMEGTCTGEHGVGQGKIKYLRAEHGAGLDVMRQIKTALDPNDLFNPGKILPL
jgi:D-lactate dehydrogenase (cytochrome)